jgi:hypothetical protein
VGESYPHDHEDERDDLAALDFSYPAEPEGAAPDSDLSALDGLVAADEQADDANVEPVFEVSNPPGTVSVTTYLDGRVKRIELSPRVTAMTEADLADEIVLIAGLATQDAKSAQYAVMLEGMREQGHDDAATRDFLTRDLDLPTPEQAQAARAQVFATRYAGDHD